MMENCKKCGEPLKEKTWAGERKIKRCGNCAALGQQVRNYRTLSDDELKIRELEVRKKYRRSMKALEIVKGERENA